jgi:hypothetical protein
MEHKFHALTGILCSYELYVQAIVPQHVMREVAPASRSGVGSVTNPARRRRGNASFEQIIEARSD